VKALVAGGAGFIGSHIVDSLLQEHYVEVTVLDNLYTGRLENMVHHKENKNFHFVKGDVRDLDTVKNLVRNVDAVFNEAAIVSVPHSLENPLLANEVNVNGTLNLLEACLNSNVKRFVQASSASIYGDTETQPLNEEMPPKPVSPYAVSEMAAENYTKVFSKVYGLPTVCLRYFNVYGPRQTYSLYSGVITIFINQLLRNQPPIILSDGKQTRDFVYVEDVVEANMLALKSKNASGEVFNIATGIATKINQIVQILQQNMSKTGLQPIYEKSRPGDIRHSCASIEKAKNILGYNPKFSIEEGLSKLVKWFSQ
jgi:UDP-glucose 4-epimerase